jgi:hypothetical protein
VRYAGDIQGGVQRWCPAGVADPLLVDARPIRYT